MPIGQLTGFRQYARWTLMLEMMQLVGQPSRRRGRAFTENGLPDLANVPASMGKVQNPKGIAPMKIDKRLTPLRAIGHRADLPRRLHSPAVRLHQRPSLKGVDIELAGEVGQVVRLNHGFPAVLLRWLNLPNGQGLHFGPFSTHQPHIGSIHAQKLFR